MVNQTFINNINCINTHLLINSTKLLLVNNTLSLDVLKCFYKFGYIESVSLIKLVNNNTEYLFVRLSNIYDRYNLKFISLIKHIKCISTPSRYVYWSSAKMPKAFLLNRKPNESFEMYLISTNKGIYSNFECIKNNIGGKVLLKIS